jgi:hypothetical protein
MRRSIGYWTLWQAAHNEPQKSLALEVVRVLDAALGLDTTMERTKNVKLEARLT